jgi:predicted Rossmann fold flavoprotein
MKETRKDVVIIGAGPAGLMCAIEAGKRGRSVLVIDHAGNIGNKIRVSGGGRCNFTNLVTDHENYISENRDFCRSALSRFTPRDFISMLEHRGIEYSEREKGQLFCRISSAEIIGMLHDACRKAGAEIRLHCRVESFVKAGHFLLETNAGKLKADSLVIATGGLSYPELGATDIGYRIARKFGLEITTLRPGLVPLTFSRQERELFGELSGISIDAIVKCRRKLFRGEVLFTHRGLSGPAILQISSYWKPGSDITIDLLPDTDIFEQLIQRRKGRIELDNMLAEFLPARLARTWCSQQAPSGPICTYSEKEYKDIADKIHHWTIRPAGSEGYKKAEVTCGGIDTNELSSKTMESKKIQGLYFVGEVVDVTGQLGGYNLQWAWSSGFAAGQHA